MNEKYFFEMMNITDAQMAKYKDRNLDHEKIANEFMRYLHQEYTDEDLCMLLVCAGFIPDLYDSDSSEETLFSKLMEVLVAEWANRMGYKAQFLKEKSSYEDVMFLIAGKVVVCDAKSFRLGRSQAAPNVKDFLKLEDIRKWLSRYDNNNRLGGMVTYPDTHEWARGSDAYLYCSTKDCPTVMLPYIYLALLLHFKNRFDTDDLAELWDYDRLFPKTLPKKSEEGNRKLYWNVVDNELIRITGITSDIFYSYIENCKLIQLECVQYNYDHIRNEKEKIINKIRYDEKNMSESEVREAYAEYKISNETKKLDDYMKRIKDFRLKNSEE